MALSSYWLLTTHIQTYRVSSATHSPFVITALGYLPHVAGWIQTHGELHNSQLSQRPTKYELKRQEDRKAAQKTVTKVFCCPRNHTPRPHRAVFKANTIWAEAKCSERHSTERSSSLHAAPSLQSSLSAEETNNLWNPSCGYCAGGNVLCHACEAVRVRVHLGRLCGCYRTARLQRWREIRGEQPGNKRARGSASSRQQ